MAGRGHLSLVIDRGGIVRPQSYCLPSLFVPVRIYFFCTHSKDEKTWSSLYRVTFRNTGRHDKSKQSQPRQPRSNIATRICATTARVVAAGSPGAWACSQGHQEPRAPSTTRPPTTTATLRPRPDAALGSTPSPPPPTRDPLLTPSASDPESSRRPQPSGRPRPPPSTPWPRRAR